MSAKIWAGCLLVTLLLTSPVLVGREAFFYRDVTRQYEPVQHQLDRALAQGELPTWNASTQSGVPLLSNVHAGVFAPWWPLFRTLGFHRAYGLSVALAWAALLAGLFTLLRRELDLASSAVGVAVAGLSGVVLGSTSYLPFLAGLACIPWQLWALQHPRGLVRVAALGGLFALQLLTGDPSTALMGGLACALLALSTTPRSLISLAGGAAVGVGLSALQLLPAWTLYTESARAASSLDTRLGWSFHPARVLEWLVRAPYGGLLEAPFFERWDLAAGPDSQPFLLEHGWGVVALLCLGPALVQRSPWRNLGLGLVGLGLFTSLGRHLGPLAAIYELPPLSLFRFPERYGALATFGGALLAAHGASVLFTRVEVRRGWALGWLGLGAALGGASLLVGPPTSDALRLTAALVALAGAIALASWRTRFGWLAALAVAGLVDGVHAWRTSLLTLPAETARADDFTALGGHRVWRENAALRALERPVRGRAAFAEERRQLHATLASATPGLHGVDELGGFSPVSLRRWQRVIQTTAGRPELLSRLFDVCWYVSTPARAAAFPSWRAVRELSPGAWLYQSSDCRGRAWTVESSVEVPDTEAALKFLSSPRFDPQRVATREAADVLPPLTPARVTEAPRPRASELAFSLGEHAGWTLLAVSETWAPGWQVTVDGEERAVELLDGTLLGVAVPPGGREVVFHYEEPLATAGLGVSLATALGLLLAWVRGRQRAS